MPAEEVTVAVSITASPTVIEEDDALSEVDVAAAVWGDCGLEALFWYVRSPMYTAKTVEGAVPLKVAVPVPVASRVADAMAVAFVGVPLKMVTPPVGLVSPEPETTAVNVSVDEFVELVAVSAVVLARTVPGSRVSAVAAITRWPPVVG